MSWDGEYGFQAYWKEQALEPNMYKLAAKDRIIGRQTQELEEKDRIIAQLTQELNGKP